MSIATFDTLTTARELEAAGVERRQAEAGAVRQAVSTDRDELATKADLAELRAATRADLYRALWIQGAALIGTQLAIAGFIVHLLSQP